MGQFLDYIASVFTAKVETDKETNNNHHNTSNHVNFADNSFTQAFTRNDSEKAAKILSLTRSNKRTIFIYQAIGAIAFIAHLSFVTVPKLQMETFDLLEPAGWQLVTLTVAPLVIYFASIAAMIEVNRPLIEGAKPSSKNFGLDLNNNDFVHSLKIVMILMAIGQLSSIFSDQLIWSVVMIVPLWCYQLTNRLAENEYKRYAPSPKKQWPRLGLPRSPKPASPVKQAQIEAARNDINQVRATPRTRARRAVKNVITGVSDTYHTLEQNVAHQLSQKIFKPLSPKLKMIE